jgi:Tol biopolymer transport system component
VIVAGRGNDRVRGGGGADLVCGGGGNDVIRGGGSGDRLFGGSGDDILSGLNGPDRLRGGAGDDRLRGGRETDQAFGGPGLDRCLSPGPPSAAGCENTMLVSVSTGGRQANGWSDVPALSGDGQCVAFVSEASSLVAGDTNRQTDVFVRDLRRGVTARVSVSSAGLQADGYSDSPALSGDARYVVFSSLASNLVPGDTNGTWDVFVHDMSTGITSRVSVATDGTQANGRSALFGGATLSSDGRYIAFGSDASNLTPGDTNQNTDVFVHDMSTGITSRVSVATDGSQGSGGESGSYGGAISGDGRYVGFQSDTENLVAGDHNGAFDVLLHDRRSGATTLVSTPGSGRQANGDSLWPTLSAHGRYIAFDSDASNLTPGDTNRDSDVFVFDRQTSAMSRVSLPGPGGRGPGDGSESVISANGRYVAFVSGFAGLTAGDTNHAGDVFVRDRRTSVTRLISVATDGGPARDFSLSPTISADGTRIAFLSDNLEPHDTNRFYDVFLRLAH